MKNHSYTYFDRIYDQYLMDIDQKRAQCSEWIHVATIHLKDEELASELQLCRQRYLRIYQTLQYDEPVFQSVDLDRNNSIFE